MSVISHIAGSLPPEAVAAALGRLTEGADPLLGRAARMARQCVRRGEVGLLAVDEFTDGGRVMVPAKVLSDLVTVALSKGPGADANAG